ncbi:HTTM domain-containing protein [Halobacteria archaeon AArc-curdl1]|uniref:HTTM domain-containing protein n=1 Tax=Natronosalvus hydrolyticus TaxID=2979988 RepID=A0AAP2Z8T7_9EURY|nr:HTTM domain-containing protein [Halobacteria archaeon AArc-curdl1]
MRSRSRLYAGARRARRHLHRCVRIDARALALFRVSLALLILADLLLRSRNFTFFYTEHGVVPRSLARELSADYAFSFYHLSTNTTVIAALFVIQALFAIQLLVGYRTTFATVVSFLFVVSLDHHNPLVLSYADVLFRLLMFWAIFVPLGERWSVDAIHRRRKPRTAVAGIATAFILGQMVYMYVTNGIIKSVSSTWRSGNAAPRVLGLDEMTFLLGDTVRQFQTFLEFGGLLWYVMMVCGWVLLVTYGWYRMPFLLLYVGGHLSFALTVRIGAFAYVALAGLLLFVQTPVLDTLERWLRRAGERSPGLQSMSRHLESTRHRLRSAGARLPPPHPRWTTDRVRQARTRIHGATLRLIIVTIVFVGVVLVAQTASVVADHDGSEPLEEVIDRTVSETLEETTGVKQVNTVASAMAIDQPVGWGVFAPNPRTTDRYYVFSATTESGEYVDAYNDRPLAYDRPFNELQRQYGTYRERFYMNSVRRGGSSTDTAAILAEYRCAEWEATHGERLTHLNMYVVSEEVTRATVDSPEDRDRSYRLFYRHGCGDNEPMTFEPPE